MEGTAARGSDASGSEQALPQSLVLEHVSPATRLLEKRRQMFEVQEALDAQKEEFARREEAFHRREEGLRKKDLELQESLIKFNKFLQENESKRNRAEKRAQEEAKQRRAKEAEIAKLKTELETMKGEFSKLEDVVSRNLKYQRYLETVQEAVPEDYPEVSDLLNRYKTLKDANADLTHRLQQHEHMNESKRGEYVHYTKEQTNDILNSNNMIASMQKALENAESDAFRVQNELDSQIRSTSDRTLEIGQALMAIDNLLQRCTSKKHGNYLKHFQASEDPQQAVQNKHLDELARKGKAAMSELDVIAAYIVDFRSIVDEMRSAGGRYRDPAAAPFGSGNGAGSAGSTEGAQAGDAAHHGHGASSGEHTANAELSASTSTSFNRNKNSKK